MTPDSATPEDPAAEFVLHNRRPPRSWLWLFALGLLVVPCFCLIHPMCALTVLLFMVAAVWPSGTRTVGMADLLFVWPTNRHVAPEKIRSFAIGADPLEDYADETQPLCELSIVFENSAPARMIVSHEEARRALQWAAAKGVATRVAHDVDRTTDHSPPPESGA